MNRSILGRTAFSAAVALAMGFGVREALASPAAAQARPFCADQADCQATLRGDVSRLRRVRVLQFRPYVLLLIRVSRRGARRRVTQNQQGQRITSPLTL